VPDSADAQFFHDAFVAGLKKHFPGTPKDSYILPWQDTPDWERRGAAAVYEQVKAFIIAADGYTTKLTRDQKSQFVAICWIAQMYKQFDGGPKASHVADWSELAQWHKETDADVFEQIEQRVRGG
jgi:hypothetical protein